MVINTDYSSDTGYNHSGDRPTLGMSVREFLTQVIGGEMANLKCGLEIRTE